MNNSPLKKFINFMTRTIDTPCIICNKNINIKQKYFNKYLVCSNKCGYKYILTISGLCNNNLNSEDFNENVSLL